MRTRYALRGPILRIQRLRRLSEASPQQKPHHPSHDHEQPTRQQPLRPTRLRRTRTRPSPSSRPRRTPRTRRRPQHLTRHRLRQRRPIERRSIRVSIQWRHIHHREADQSPRAARLVVEDVVDGKVGAVRGGVEEVGRWRVRGVGAGGAVDRVCPGLRVWRYFSLKT